MQGERWPPSTNPSAKLRAARAMPPWIQARGSAIPPPPPPPPSGPPPIEPEYEVIEFAQQTYSNQPAIRSKEKEKKRCDLCGSSVPAVKCMQCVQQTFCYSCDEMYHRHPKRQTHVRRELDVGGGGGRLPPLPPKGEPPPPPVPPPRRNKRATPRPTPPPPKLPPSPHNLQRDSISPKPGIVGSLKRMIGVRPLPVAPHTIDRQNSLPPSASMMNFHDQQMGNGFPDWNDMHRGHRSGSFSTLNPSHFGHMMQAQSMAQLNCPSCHGHGVWTPWGGMGPQGNWQSQGFLNRGPPQEEWSDSDSDAGWQRERLRRFSTMSARAPRGYVLDEVASQKGGRRRQDFDTMSSRGGKRQDLETMSVRGGRKQDFDTMSNRGGRRSDFETMSTRGGKKQDFETMSLRGGRRSDLESPLIRSRRKFIDDRPLRNEKHNKHDHDSESSEERESDDEFIFKRGGKKTTDSEDGHKGRRRSEPPSPLPQLKKTDSTSRKKGRRNERFSDTGRRRSSPVNYKYESPSGEEEKEEEEQQQSEEPANENGKVQNGIEFIDAGVGEEEEELASIPDMEWECAHCTFVNEPGSRVCTICCKTSTKPKPLKLQSKPQAKPQSPPIKLEDDLKKLKVDIKQTKEVQPAKNEEKTEKIKERRGTQSPERNPRTLMSTGTSPPPQSISTQTYEEGGRKLKRATSLADYSDWKAPQRSASRQSLLSDTQSLKRAGSQPPEYLSTLVQKQVKQGLEMVKLLREAEDNQFTADDLAVALIHCGDSDPIVWLQDNWRNMIDTVVTLGTNYGQERKENTVGTISASEARESLHMHDGNVWAAVTECVEQRQKKYAELLSRGNFSREDIVTVLTANRGNLEEAYKELNKNQLKPFLMRIWGPPQGADNDEGDYTKLAHGEVEGRGGKNSEEVSVDLSVDSNYERIQNWLEDYVHTNNYLNSSQSMLQLNTGGLKRSVSDWKVNNPSNLSRSNSTIFKNRRNSDVHRYLTTLYNANDKTLLLNKHSTSTFNLVNIEKTDANAVQGNEAGETSAGRILSTEKIKREEDFNNEVETVTIKLNPTIVKSEPILQKDEKEKLERQNEASESESKESESESEESESGSEESESESSNEEASHKNNTVQAEIQQLQVENKSGQSGSISRGQGEVSDLKQKIPRSESQTSSESFESVHSSVENDINEKLKGKLHKKYQSADASSITVGNELPDELHSSQEIFSETDLHDYVNITVNKDQGELIETTYFNVEETSSSFNKFNNDLKEESVQKLGGESILELTSKSPSLSIKIEEESPETSISTNETDDKYEEVSSDDEIPFIEDNSENQPDSESIDMVTVPIAVFDDTLHVDSDSSHKHSSEQLEETMNLSYGKKTERRIRSNIAKHSGNLLMPEKRRGMNKRQKYYAVSRSDSDMNDDRSMDFSEESMEYNERKMNSPIIALKRDTSLRFSEANSDRDVSSIPTDSEKELVVDRKLSPQHFDNQFSHNNVDIKNAFHANQAELLDLLKKSLSKDDVVERIVSTLFASVLQASDMFKDQQQFINPKKELINENRLEQLQEFTQGKVYATVTEEHTHFVNESNFDSQQAKIQEDSIIATQNTMENTNSKVAPDTFEKNLNEINTGKYEDSMHGAVLRQLIDSQSEIDQQDGRENKQDTSLSQDVKNEVQVSLLQANENEMEEILSEVIENKIESGDLKPRGVMDGDLSQHNGKKIEVSFLNSNENEMETSPEANKTEIISSEFEASKSTLEDNSVNLTKNEIEPNVPEIYENKITVNELQVGETKLEENSVNISNEVEIASPKVYLEHVKANDLEVGVREVEDKFVNINKNKVEATASGVNKNECKVSENEVEGNLLNVSKNNIKVNENNKNFDQKYSINKETASQIEGNDNKLTPRTGKINIERNGYKSNITPLKQKEVVVKDKVNKTFTTPPTKNIGIKKKSILLSQLSQKFEGTPEKQPNVLKKNVKGTSSLTVKFSSPESNIIEKEKLSSEEYKKEPTQESPVTESETDNPEREARRLLAEGLVMTYQQAEIAVQLKELKLDDAQILAAAKECHSLEAAVAYLQQECQLCAGKYSVKQMVSMLECEHVCCLDCATNYFTLQITERNINDCVCPFCKEPDILHVDDDKAITYLSNLDIFLKRIVKENIHELFQRKLRDRTLMQDPNFKWCVKCSSGFIANPRQTRLICPDCKAITCAKCMKPWEQEHENMSCEEYKTWFEQNDPDHQLIKHLDENGVTCPNCKTKYLLAKGGCMHLTCPQCKHEFCSGCSKPFLMGRKCNVSEYCEKLGLHSHHPRNCLFYLRDKEPEELEKLLEDNNIAFNRNVDTDTTKRCAVQILRENPDGMTEGICGYETMKAGLCRKHYVEWLSRLVRGSSLETMCILNEDDLETVVRRSGRRPPSNPYGTPRPVYRAALIQVIEKEIPLD